MKYSATIYFLLFLALAVNSAKAQSTSFTADKHEGCAPLTVNFANTSTDTSGIDYTFYYDGHTTTQPVFTHTFDKPGAYYVMLYAYKNGAYAGGASQFIKVNGPYHDFYISTYSSKVCPGDDIEFNSWDQADSYQWSFGDGASATTSDIHHSYAAPGTYPVTLITSSVCGTDTTVKNIIADNKIKPVTPDFQPNMGEVFCPGQEVSFYIYNYGVGSNKLSFHWDFGDGQSFNGNNASHVYSTLGNYNVVLTATNNCGLSSSKNGAVVITDTIGQTKPVFYTWQAEGCPARRYLFYGYGSYLYKSFSWNFGDGTTNNTDYSITHAFPAAGTYIVSFTATNYCGNTNTFTDTLYVTDTIATTQPYFYLVEDSLCPGDEFQVYDPYVSPYGGQSSLQNTTVWDFGDGTIDTTATPHHTFAAPGDYVITRTQLYPCNASSSYTQTMHIVNSARPLTPFISANNACPGETIRMVASIQIPFTYGLVTAYNAALYTWDFGDGTTLTTTSGIMYHHYDSVGDYHLSLTVTNSCGNSKTQTQDISITNSEVPLADFMWQDSNQDGMFSPCESISFSSYNIFSGTYPIMHYIINFGDSTALETDSLFATHTYAAAGQYTISVTATNLCGNSNTQQRDITIQGFCTGTTDITGQKSEVIVYPNPFSASATIEVKNTTLQNGELRLYNLMGQEVMKAGIYNSKAKVERGSLPPGVYFYRIIEKDNLVGTGKVIAE